MAGLEIAKEAESLFRAQNRVKKANREMGKAA